MSVLRFMHAKLDVRDMPTSLDFYQRLLGLEVIVRHGLANGEIVQLAPPGTLAGVELWFEQEREIEIPTEWHIAFAVSDTRHLVEHLRSEGVVVSQEPFEIGDEVIAFVLDPDGYSIELNQLSARDR